MAFDLDDEELKYTRKMKGLDKDDKHKKEQQKSEDGFTISNGYNVRYQQRPSKKI